MHSGMKKKTSYFFCHSTLLHYLCRHDGKFIWGVTPPRQNRSGVRLDVFGQDRGIDPSHAAGTVCKAEGGNLQALY